MFRKNKQSIDTKPQNQPSIVVRDLVRSYKVGNQSVNALQGVNISFKSGMFTAIMGPSGSGKSTFLQCVAGLDQPTRGEVIIDSVSISKLNQTELSKLRRDKIGFIFQQFNLIPSLNATQNILLPLRLAGRKYKKSIAIEALDTVGLKDRAKHYPVELSGGQQQRIAIARALVTRPAVVFADEPTGALDSSTGRDVLNILKQLVDKHRQTVVMVTHDPRAAAYADRVVFIVDGKIAGEIAGGDPDKVAKTMAQLGAE